MNDNERLRSLIQKCADAHEECETPFESVIVLAGTAAVGMFVSDRVIQYSKAKLAQQVGSAAVHEHLDRIELAQAMHDAFEQARVAAQRLLGVQGNRVLVDVLDLAEQGKAAC